MAVLDQFTLSAPAKINLFLHVTGRRADGYHSLQTVFQLLSLADQLEFQAAETLRVVCDEMQIEAQQNLVYKAAKLLQDYTGTTSGCEITINKRIPTGAGLGGGSSNAATALHGLNLYWQLGLDADQLAELGSQLGADVPVFVHGCAAWAEGIGDQLTAVTLPEFDYVVIFPGVSTSTAEVFQHPDLTRDTRMSTIARFLTQRSDGWFEKNDCESVACEINPAIAEALRFLNQWGTARMSGSGSSVFVKVESGQDAARIESASPSNWSVFRARGMNRSMLLSEMEALSNT